MPTRLRPEADGAATSDPEPAMKGRLLRNTVFGSMAGGSATICNFITGLIIARLLGARLMGEVAFMTWIANTASILVMLGIPFTMSKYLLEREARSGSKAALSLARSWLWPFVAIASVPAMLALALAATGEPVRSQLRHVSESLGGRSELILAGLLCFLLSVGEFARAVSRGTHRFDELAGISIVSGVVQCVTALLCVGAYGVDGALAAYAMGCLALLVLLRPLFAAEPESVRGHAADFRRYAAFRWGSEILALFVWSRIEIIFLQYYCDASSVALFTVALTLASLAVQGPLMLTWGLMPHFVERHAHDDHQGMQDAFAAATRLLSMLVLPCCFGMAAIAHSLVPLLFGAAFVPAEHVAEILVVASAYPAVGAAVGSVLLASDRSDVDFFSCLVGMVVSLLLGLLLTRYGGLMGAAWSRVIVQVFVASCGILFLHFRVGLVAPLKVLAKLTLSAGCCALVAAVVSRIGPGVVFLVLAILAGAATYISCLRALSLLEAGEIDLLRRLAGRAFRPLLKPLVIDRSVG